MSDKNRFTDNSCGIPAFLNHIKYTWAMSNKNRSTDLSCGMATHVGRQCTLQSHYPPQQCKGSAATPKIMLIWANLIRPKEGDTQASAKEAGNKPILSAVLPLCCLPTWVITWFCHKASQMPLYVIKCQYDTKRCPALLLEWSCQEF